MAKANARDARRAKAKAKMTKVAKVDSTKNASTGYLKLPSGIEKYEVEAKTVMFDIISYPITVDSAIDGGFLIEDEFGYNRLFHTHGNIGASKLTVVCPATIGEKCPICEEIAKLKQDYETNKETIKAIKRKNRALYNIYDENDKLSVLDMSTFCFEQPLRKELDGGKDEYQDFQFLDEGKSLRVRFEEVDNGGGFTFMKVDRVDFEDREDIDEAILKDIADLDACLEIKPYKELKELLYSTDEDEEEEDEVVEEETPTRRSRASKVAEKVEEVVEEIVEEVVEAVEEIVEEVVEKVEEAFDADEDWD